MGKKRKKPVKQQTQQTKVVRTGLDKFYHDYYRQLLIIPIILLLLAFVVIGVNFYQTGTLVQTGVSLSGGLTLTISVSEPIDQLTLEERLRSELPNDLLVRETVEFGVQRAITIQAAPITPDEDLQALEERVVSIVSESIPGLSTQDYTAEIVGPTLGQAFLKQTVFALIFAFFLMSAVVFYYFRSFIPSFAIVLAAFSNMIVTLAAVIMLDIRLSTAGIAAFLMLIGYSVDTDILLTTRVLKRKGMSVYDRIKSAIGTGLLMNASTLAAITASLLVTRSEAIQQIMIILLIGLIVDMINTWIQNAGILRWYAEKTEAKGGGR